MKANSQTSGRWWGGPGRQSCRGPSRPPGHSPHPAIGFAVGRVYADGSLTVLHSPSVVPEFAVGRGSGETKQGRQSWGACSLPRRSLSVPIGQAGEGDGTQGCQGLLSAEHLCWGLRQETASWGN